MPLDALPDNGFGDFVGTVPAFPDDDGVAVFVDRRPAGSLRQFLPLPEMSTGGCHVAVAIWPAAASTVSWFAVVIARPHGDSVAVAVERDLLEPGFTLTGFLLAQRHGFRPKCRSGPDLVALR